MGSSSSRGFTRSEYDPCYYYKQYNNSLSPQRSTNCLQDCRRSWGKMSSNFSPNIFQGQQPLAVVPGDPEANPDNLIGSRQVAWEPAAVRLYIGLRVFLTKNINKQMDFVNGMTAFVEGLYRSGVRARTACNTYTEEEHRRAHSSQ